MIPPGSCPVIRNFAMIPISKPTSAWPIMWTMKSSRRDVKVPQDCPSYRLTGRPENQPGSRDRPKFHDDQSPNCGLAGTTSRCVALPAGPRRACQPDNSAGACRPTSMRLPDLGLTLGCRLDTRRCLDRDHGPDPDPRNLALLRSRNQPGSRDLPRCPGYPSPSCSLPDRQIRSAVELTE